MDDYNSVAEKYDQIIFHHYHFKHYIYPENTTNSNIDEDGEIKDYDEVEQIMDIASNSIIGGEDYVAGEAMSEDYDIFYSPLGFEFTDWLIENELMGEDISFAILYAEAKQHYADFVYGEMRSYGVFRYIDHLSEAVYRSFIDEFVNILLSHTAFSSRTSPLVDDICSYLHNQDSDELQEIKMDLKFRYCSGSQHLLEDTLDLMSDLEEIVSNLDDNSGFEA